MYHQPSKRKVLIQRIAVYGLMTIATVGLVTVLVFVMLGYQFNKSDGKIEQGGLVQFDSRPTGADVTIDGAAFGTRTASKTTMTSGQHFITMSRTGYKTWQKSIDVVPGSVLWLNYTRLIPNDLTPSSAATLSSATGAVASEDNKWLAVKEAASTPVIKLADISQDKVKMADLTLPVSSFTAPSEGKTQSFAIDSWDPDSRYLLVKHTYNDDATEWLVVDTQNVAATKNMTTLLDVAATKVVFSNNNSHILYAKIGSDVRKIDLNAATLSRPLATNVAEFALYSDSMITFTTERDGTTGTRSVGYYVDGADAPRIVKTYTDDGTAPLHFVVGRYFSDTIESIAYGDTLTMLKGDLPRDDTTKITLKDLATMPLVGGAQYLTDMTNGRFIVAQNGATIAVYDLELTKSTTFTLKGAGDVTKQLKWLDNYTMWSDRDGTVRLYEFDGANQQNIMQVEPGFDVALSPNSKYLYGITKASDGSYHLTRVKLILS